MTNQIASLSTPDLSSRLIRFAVLAAVFTFTATLAYGWDAGPVQCKRGECSSGVGLITVFSDTQPKYANSVLPSDSCPAGTEWYLSGCYGASPAGWSRTAVCTMHKNGGWWWDLWTDCSRFGYYSFPTKTCPADRENYLGLCYTRCPAGSVRTAVSTCTHSVNWRANTHLYIVNRALDLLANSPDANARRAASKLNNAACKDRIMDGIWDGDDGELADTPTKAMGSHFYNAAQRDAFGALTSVIGYIFLGEDMGRRMNARSSINARLANIGDLSKGDQCHELGLALHYLTDLTQPMHTSSFSGGQEPLFLHPVYEEYVGMIQSRYPVNAAWDGRWKTSSSDVVLQETAKRSNTYAPGLMSLLSYTGTLCSMITPDFPYQYLGKCFVNDPDVNAKTGEILRDAYQSTASFIYSVVQSVPDSAAAMEGKLLRVPATGAVSFIYGGHRKWIPDAMTFNALGFSWDAIQDEPNVAQLPDGGAYPSLEPGKLPRNPDNGAIYKLEEGFRRWIPDQNTFFGLGLRSEDVRNLPAQSINAIPEGPAIPRI